jgi:2-desacetyl-2-hydroxyethyl bacteriochlorophyllide A dehydrogenase
MRAAVLHRPGVLSVENVPDPQPGPSDVVVEVRAAGICGSDLMSFRTGDYVSEDQVLGHEFAGVVSSVGEAVTGIRPGERVTAMPLGRCGVCRPCQADHANLCRRVLENAVGYGRAGAMAQQVVVPSARLGVNIFGIHDSSFAAAAMIEPLAVALRAVNRAGTKPGMTALVLGLGVIGQCIVRLLAHRGVDPLGVELSPMRRECARSHVPAGRFGAGVDDVLGDVSGRRRADVVIDASGAAHLIAEGVSALAPAGRLVVVSLPASSPPLDLKRLAVLEHELVGSYGYDTEFAAAHHLVETGQVVVEDLVTANYPLEHATSAFDAASDTDNHLKIQLAGP